MTKKPFPHIIWLAIVVHIAWGFALVLDPSVASVGILVGLHWVLTLGVTPMILGVLLIAAAVLAAVGLIMGHRLSNSKSLFMLLPQYTLLLAALFSDTQSIIVGRVGERDVDRVLLFVVLVSVMAMAVLHTHAIIERHWQWTHQH